MPEQVTQLSLNDFALVVNIIDTCTERGAFKGNELSVIGQLREKLVIFVKENTPDQTETATEEVTSTEEA